jgi:hypothetical protein
MDAYSRAQWTGCWRSLPDGEARLFVECVRRAFEINPLLGQPAPFRLMRRDLSYRISASRFGRLKRSLLKQGLIWRQARSDGGRLRDYFKLSPDALMGRD